MTFTLRQDDSNRRPLHIAGTFLEVGYIFWRKDRYVGHSLLGGRGVYAFSLSECRELLEASIVRDLKKRLGCEDPCP